MDSHARRLPLFLLLDCSESMVGDPLDAVNRGVRDLALCLKDDPAAIETVVISVIAFGGRARQMTPLAEVMDFRPPNLIVEPGTHLGGALKLLAECMKTQVRKGTADIKGDYKPMIFLVTDGQPTDDWRAGLADFQKACGASKPNFIAVGLGEDVDFDVLRAITPVTLQMTKIDSDKLLSFFKWMSASVSSVSTGFERAGAPVRTPDLPEGTAMAPADATSGKTPSQYLLLATCAAKKLPYLMRYRRSGANGYDAEKAYRVSDDYLSLSSSTAAGRQIEASQLRGSPPCPYCGNAGWRPSPTRAGLECAAAMETSSGGKARVMFVLDVTGSMEGEIDGVKNNIGDFVDAIRKQGLAVEVGLVAFRDLEEHEPPVVLQFGRSAFTDDPAKFRKEMGALSASGGGGNPGESSYDGIVQACQQKWADDETRILILITDEPPLLPDGAVRSVADVGKALRKAKIDQLHLVLPPHLNDVYQPLLAFVPGEIFPFGSRDSYGFGKVLQNVGKSITVTTRIG